MGTLAPRRRNWFKPYPDAIDQGHGSQRGTPNAVRDAVLAISGFFLSRTSMPISRCGVSKLFLQKKSGHKCVTSEKVEGYDSDGG